MHQAWRMARAIYSLKMFLLRPELKLGNEDKETLKDICLFIVTVYVKPWLKCNAAVKAPNQDLWFLRSLKANEMIDTTVSKEALKKFCQYLWYLSEEVSVLLLSTATTLAHKPKLKRWQIWTGKSTHRKEIYSIWWRNECSIIRKNNG